MHRFRRLGKFGLLPAAVWLLAQMIMTGPPAPAVAATAVFDAVATSAAANAICTLSATPDQDHSGNGTAKISGQCKWCQAFGKVPPPSPPNLSAFLPLLASGTIVHRIAAQRPAGGIRVSFTQSRAPPL